MIPALAAAAVRDVNTLTNPVRLDAAGYEGLLRAAM
jgi:alcohol dehydrogenase class IV